MLRKFLVKFNSYKNIVGCLALLCSFSANAATPAADQCNLVKMKVLILSKRLKDASYTETQKTKIKQQLVEVKNEYKQFCVRDYR